MADGRQGLLVDRPQVLFVGENAADDEVHRYGVAFENAGRNHFRRVQNLTVGVIETGRVENVFVHLRKLRVFGVFHLEVADHGLHAPGDVTGQFKEELAGVKSVPILFGFGGETVFRRPEFVPRRNGVRQRITAEKGVRPVVDRTEGRHEVCGITHPFAAGGKQHDHGVKQVKPVFRTVFRRKQFARVFLFDHFHHLPESRDIITSAAGSVFVFGIIAVAPCGASDHIQIHSGQPCIAQLFHQISHLALENGRFAAHIPQTVVVVAVERHRIVGAVPSDLDLVGAPFVVGRAVQIPGTAVDVHLSEDPLIVHPLHGVFEGFHSFTGGPEVGIVGVIRVVVPPVPVQSDGHACIGGKPFSGRKHIIDPSSVPEPHGHILRGIFFTEGVFVPDLFHRPFFVDHGRFEPFAFELRHAAAVGQCEAV